MRDEFTYLPDAGNRRNFAAPRSSTQILGAYGYPLQDFEGIHPTTFFCKIAALEDR